MGFFTLRFPLKDRKKGIIQLCQKNRFTFLDIKILMQMRSVQLSPMKLIKKATRHPEFVAARCGNSNQRIDTILDYFNCPLPQFIGDVTPRVEDIMRSEIRSITKRNTCYEALEKIDRHDIRALPVVDQDNRVEGLCLFSS